MVAKLHLIVQPCALVAFGLAMWHLRDAAMQVELSADAHGEAAQGNREVVEPERCDAESAHFIEGVTCCKEPACNLDLESSDACRVLG